MMYDYRVTRDKLVGREVIRKILIPMQDEI